MTKVMDLQVYIQGSPVSGNVLDYVWACRRTLKGIEQQFNPNTNAEDIVGALDAIIERTRAVRRAAKEAARSTRGTVEESTNRYMFEVRHKKPTGQRYATFHTDEIHRLVREARAKGRGSWDTAGMSAQWVWLCLLYTSPSPRDS